MRLRTHGFTLVELAIVLAIIGLIAGAVLMSKDSLFGRAGVASLLSNIRDLAAASRDFKTRYGYFPGDLPNAKDYVSGVLRPGPCDYVPTTPGIAGPGDGIVNVPAESDCALEHLVKAGMLSKVDYDGVRYVIKSSVGDGGRLSLWYDSGTNVNAIRATNLPCDIALEIDRKLDSATTDNTPFGPGHGSVTARDGSDAPIATCIPGSTNDPVATLLITY